jgi:TPR repeat protein
MKKSLTFLLALTFLFLFSGSSVVFADDFQDGLDAYDRKDYQEAVKWFRLSAEQGDANAQSNLGKVYHNGQGVPQDYVLAHMWWNIAGSNGYEDAVKKRNIVEKKMSPSQIGRAQELARQWPTKQQNGEKETERSMEGHLKNAQEGVSREPNDYAAHKELGLAYLRQRRMRKPLLLSRNLYGSSLIVKRTCY